MNIRDAIKAYAAVARPVIRERFLLNSCIASTAITCKVLDKLGFRAEALPVRVGVYNRAAAERLGRDMAWPRDPATIAEWAADGCWAIMIGHPDTPAQPNAWNGHLVAVVDGWMIDASIDQASRPEKSIVLPEVLYSPIPRAFRRGRANLQVRGPSGTVIAYAPTKSQGWRASRDWSQNERHVAAVAQIMFSLDRPAGGIMGATL